MKKIVYRILVLITILLIVMCGKVNNSNNNQLNNANSTRGSIADTSGQKLLHAKKDCKAEISTIEKKTANGEIPESMDAPYVISVKSHRLALSNNDDSCMYDVLPKDKFKLLSEDKSKANCSLFVYQDDTFNFIISGDVTVHQLSSTIWEILTNLGHCARYYNSETGQISLEFDLSLAIDTLNERIICSKNNIISIYHLFSPDIDNALVGNYVRNDFSFDDLGRSFIPVQIYSNDSLWYQTFSENENSFIYIGYSDGYDRICSEKSDFESDVVENYSGDINKIGDLTLICDQHNDCFVFFEENNRVYLLFERTRLSVNDIGNNIYEIHISVGTGTSTSFYFDNFTHTLSTPFDEVKLADSDTKRVVCIQGATILLFDMFGCSQPSIFSGNLSFEHLTRYTHIDSISLSPEGLYIKQGEGDNEFDSLYALN